MSATHSPFALRPIRLDDAAPVAPLIRAAFAEQPVTPDPPLSALRVTADDVAAHLATGGGVVAEAGDALVGSALWTEHRGLYVGRVAVAPEWRRRGLARMMLAAAEAEARRRGLDPLWLSTRLVLTGNRRLFAACGFVETAQHAHPGYARPTYVDMEKRLGGLLAASRCEAHN